MTVVTRIYATMCLAQHRIQGVRQLSLNTKINIPVPVQYEPGPADRESVVFDTHVLHQLHVSLVTMVLAGVGGQVLAKFWALGEDSQGIRDWKEMIC